MLFVDPSRDTEKANTPVCSDCQAGWARPGEGEQRSWTSLDMLSANSKVVGCRQCPHTTHQLYDAYMITATTACEVISIYLVKFDFSFLIVGRDNNVDMSKVGQYFYKILNILGLVWFWNNRPTLFSVAKVTLELQSVDRPVRLQPLRILPIEHHV